MFDKLLTNKYFCLSLILLLLVVLYLYTQKNSCDVETMRNVDLTPLIQEVSEDPWTDDKTGLEYRKVGDKFDKMADHLTKLKLKKNGYSYTKFLGRSDESLKNYLSREEFSSESVPKPLDSHPELSQCQPCKCPQDDLLATEEESPRSTVRKSKKRKNSKPRKSGLY